MNHSKTVEDASKINLVQDGKAQSNCKYNLCI